MRSLETRGTVGKNRNKLNWRRRRAQAGLSVHPSVVCSLWAAEKQVGRKWLFMGNERTLQKEHFRYEEHGF